MEVLDKENKAVGIEKNKHNVEETSKMPFVVAAPDNLSDCLQSESQRGTPCERKPAANLLQSIQDHLQQEGRRLQRRSLFKESAVKYSVDKDFGYLFEQSAVKKKLPVEAEDHGLSFHMGQHENSIWEWLGSDQQKTLSYLNFKSFSHLLEMLPAKIKGLSIVVTNFHGLLSEQLESLNMRRKTPIQWASLSSTLTVQIKSRILELYELNKLQLLLITPELFQNETYHSFECQLLTIFDMHLYTSIEGRQSLQKIMKKVSAGRKLGCYEHLSYEASQLFFMPNLTTQPSAENPHQLLQSTDKPRTLINFIQRNEFKKILVLVSDRLTSIHLTDILSLQSAKTINFVEVIPKYLMKGFTLPNFLTKQHPNQQKLNKFIEKSRDYSIIVSTYFEGLRMLDFDLVVNYSVSGLDTVVQYEKLAPNALTLVCDQDYFMIRNSLCSLLLDMTTIDKITNNLLDLTTVEKQQPGKRRFFSQTMDDILLKKFSVDKQSYLTSDMKSIRISKFCQQLQITRQQFDLVVESMEELHLVNRLMKSLSYECWIQESDMDIFQTMYPQAVVTHGKANLLDLSNSLNITTKQLLNGMKKNKIRYTVSEEILPLKILSQKKAGTIYDLMSRLKNKVLNRVQEMDLSYAILIKAAYPNLQFLRRDRLHTKQKDFLKNIQDYIRGNRQNLKELMPHLPHTRINNLREQAYSQKSIEQWMEAIDFSERGMSPHDIVMYLLGVVSTKLDRHEDSSGLFGSYNKYKYEEMIELVERLVNAGMKKLKL